MKIKEIHIDGFGVFSGLHLTGIGPGINLVYGANEFGKSTFLEFVRRVMFGYPDARRRLNQYPALNGGAYGGWLAAELDNNGGELRIERGKGRSGGDLSVFLDGRELPGGQPELDRILRMNEHFYRNVYAISLDELQQLESLDNEEIRNRIYGAGLNLGGASLGDCRKHFTEISEEIFKVSGRKQILPELYREMRRLEGEIREAQNALSRYDELHRKREELLTESENSDAEVRQLRRELLTLDNRRKLFPNYLEIVEKEKELAKIGEVREFSHDDAVEQTGKLEERREILKRGLSETGQEMKQLDARIKQVEINEQLLEHQDEVIILVQRSEQYRGGLRDMENLEIKRGMLNAKIAELLAKLGDGWNEENAASRPLTIGNEGRLAEFRERFREIEERAAKNKAMRELLEQRKLAELKPVRIPSQIKILLLVFCLLALAGIVLGMIYSWILFGFSVIILIGAFIMLLSGNSRNDESQNNEEIPEDGLVRDRENLKNEWKSFLEENFFDPELNFAGVGEAVRLREELPEKMAERESVAKQIESHGKFISETEALLVKLRELVPGMSTRDISAGIEIIAAKLKESENALQRRNSLQERSGELSAKQISLAADLEDIEKEIAEKYAEYGVAGREELLREFAVYNRKLELKNHIDVQRKIIRVAVGAGEEFDKFIKAMAGQDQQETAILYGESENRLHDAEKAQKERQMEIGRIERELSDLTSSDQLLEKQNELSIVERRMNDAARDWTRSQIALAMLKKTVARYEKERQPQVIKYASGYFSDITGGRYTVSRSIDGNELQVSDVQGNIKQVDELSRGTREELYFAMRLGLIGEYEDNSESMPVVMDDVLVNFDDSRRERAIEALLQFAKNRQVFILTCHERIQDLLKMHGVYCLRLIK